MIGQYPNMEHIWIGKYYLGLFSYLDPLCPWRITVKGSKFLNPK